MCGVQCVVIMRNEAQKNLTGGKEVGKLIDANANSRKIERS